MTASRYKGHLSIWAGSSNCYSDEQFYLQESSRPVALTAGSGPLTPRSVPGLREWRQLTFHHHSGTTDTAPLWQEGRRGAGWRSSLGRGSAQVLCTCKIPVLHRPYRGVIFTDQPFPCFPLQLFCSPFALSARAHIKGSSRQVIKAAPLCASLMS